MMAPESERACTKCGHPRNAHDLEQPYECFHLPEGAFEYSCDCDGFSYAPEPTLTCSEVVERLATGCSPPIGVGSKVGYFDRAKAEAILHSWRERRVQELPILEKFEDEIALHGGFGLTIDQLENLRAALVSAIGKANYPRKSRADQEGREA